MVKTYPKRKAGSSAKAAPKSSKATVALQTSFRFLLFMAQRHPILLWTGSWLVLMLMSWLAIAGLTYTNPEPLVVESAPPETVIQPTQLQREFHPHKPATSLGLIVGVAGLCTVTSALLARRLRPAKPAPRPVIKRSTKGTSITAKASAKSAAVPPGVDSAQMAPPSTRPEATLPTKLPTKVASHTMPPKIASTSQSAKRAATVVAPETRNRTLVELMDIRKRDSVTSR